MDLTDDEREFLRAMRAITVDHDGNEIFLGLDAEESQTFLTLTRKSEAGEIVNYPRFIELRARHEAARQSIILGKEHLDQP